MNDVEISIVNHANRDLLRSCLRSIPDACDGISFHATVVDNDSNDGSLEMIAAEFGDVEVIVNRVRRGYGANQNQVLRPTLEQNTATYVLASNDDVVYHPYAISRMVKFLERLPHIGATAPSCVDEHGVTQPSRGPFPTLRGSLDLDHIIGLEHIYYPSRDEWPATTHTSDDGYLEGCCLLLRVDALQSVGLFDEQFFLFFEDVDLSRRLLNEGWTLAVCSEACVSHFAHASVFRHDMVKMTYQHFWRSRYLYLAKHFGRSRTMVMTMLGKPWLLGRGLFYVISGAIRRDGDRMFVGEVLLEAGWGHPLKPTTKRTAEMSPVSR